ncbi:MAG: translocation/assembly module TamB domain-containing protein [Pseudomonadota bacterium]
MHTRTSHTRTFHSRATGKVTAALALTAALVVAPVGGQTTDEIQDTQEPDFLERIIQNALGGEGREVRIIDLQGPLSANVTIAGIEVEDVDGVWLSIENVSMEWRRLALLRGRINISDLSIGSINLVRAPVTPPSDLPPPEAVAEAPPREPFQLPELPVSVDVGLLEIGQLALGQDLVGQAAEFALKGNAQLAGGEGGAALRLTRTDGLTSGYGLVASFDNESRQLVVDLNVAEDRGGLITSLAGFPGAPSLSLTVAGDNPLTDFIATIALATDDEPRLGGTLRLRESTSDTNPEAFVQTIDATLGGDVTALFAPQYQPFFGPNVGLAASVRVDPDAGTFVDTLNLSARALSLAGTVQFAPSGIPLLVDVSGNVGTGDGRPVALPIPGSLTEVTNANLRLDYDANAGEAFTMSLDASDVRQDTMRLGGATVRLDGTLSKTDAPLTIAGVAASLAAELRNIAVDDQPEVANTFTDPITFDGEVTWDAEPGTVTVRNLALVAGDLRVNGLADVVDLATSPTVTAEVTLDTGDLDRFAALAGQALQGSLTGALNAELEPRRGAFDVTLTGTSQDIGIGTAQVDQLLAGRTELDIAAKRDVNGLALDRLELGNAQLNVSGTGSLRANTLDLALDGNVAEAGLLADHLAGNLSLNARVTGRGDDYDADVTLGGQAIETVLGAPARLTGAGSYAQTAGTALLDSLSLTAGDLSVTGQAQASGLNDQPVASADLTMRTGDLARFAPLADMPLQGTLALDIEGDVDTAAQTFAALVTGEGDTIQIGVAEVDQLLAGRTDINIDASGSGETIQINSFDITNQELTVAGGGSVAAEGGDVTLDAQLRDLGLFVPNLSGPLTLQAQGNGSNSAWDFAVTAAGPSELSTDLSGTYTPTNLDVDLVARLGDIAPFVGKLSGPIAVNGTLTGENDTYLVDLTADALGGLTAQVSGTALSPDGNADLAIAADVPLTLAGPFIAPRSLTGNVIADLTLQGPPAVESLRGTVRLADTRFSDPSSKLVLETIAGTVTMDAGQAVTSIAADLATGGQIRVSGPVALSDPFNGNLDIVLDQLNLVDPALYEIQQSGEINVSGPLTGGANIVGQIDLGRVELRIPTSFGAGGPIIEIEHVNEPRPSLVTRERAGLVIEPEPAEAAGGNAPAYGLNVAIDAPQRIFVRGRGLDVEFGGRLTVGGTTDNIIPSGRFELVRGRLDILTQVLEFSEATITLGGDLVPQVFMVAESEDATIDAQIEISGPVDQPELRFTSDPELPEDEVLAQLFFGKSIAELSPLEAVELVSAIATLTGRSGGGLLGGIRDSIGVDRLNVGQDDEGNAEVTAGKYITDDIYTDLTVNAEGTSRIRLNYDIRPGLTTSGSFDNEGDTRIGIGFARDY